MYKKPVFNSVRTSTLFQPFRDKNAGLWLVVLAALLWSSSGVFIKVITLDPLPLAGYRSLLGGVALLPFIRWRQVQLNRVFGVAAVAFTLTSLTFTLATRWTAAANAIALQSTAPAWVFVIFCIHNRQIPWNLAPPLLLSLAGVVAFLLEPVAGVSFQGNLMGLVSGVFFALTMYFTPLVKQSSISLVAQLNLFAGVALVLIDPGAYHPQDLTLSQWAALLYLGVVQIGMAYVFYTIGARLISPTQAAMLTLLEPVFNPIWVFWVVGEVPSSFAFVGEGLVLSGIVADALLRRYLARKAMRAISPPPGAG